MSARREADRRDRYQITVQGKLDPQWTEWLNGMAMTDENDVTTLTCLIADQAALRGILCKLWDLNLTLVSVRREVDGTRKEKVTK